MTTNSFQNSNPIIVSVEMGYGHLRPAYTLADSLGVEVVRLDAAPAAGFVEAALWKTVYKSYNRLSRACDWPGAGRFAKMILESATRIPPLQRQPEPANLMSYFADGATRAFVGRRFRNMASGAGSIVATYPVAAFAAARLRNARVFCLVTDTDSNRAWAPANADRSDIEYFAPVQRVADRLRSFGVPGRKIHVTGFPLPAKLVEGASAALARRLCRLDAKSVFRIKSQGADAFIRRFSQPCSAQPISMTIAIGGAGAQTRQAGAILQALKARISEGRFKLTLVAGIRFDVANRLKTMVQSAGLEDRLGHGIDILFAGSLKDYFQQFDDCLADTDLLWTKPSELVFYASLGVPMLLSEPLGGQERANREWLLSNDAAFDAGDPAMLDCRLEQLLSTGELCRIAWNAYSRLERNGAERIKQILGKEKNLP